MDNNTAQKKITILGSTGSIGCSTIDVVKNLKRTGYDIEVLYLTTNTRIDILARQCLELNPKGVVITNKQKAQDFKDSYFFPGLEILSGEEGLIEIARRDDHNIFVSSLVGFAGLRPTIEAIKAGKQIALANKETLVVAGSLISSLLKKHNVKLLPIDSEHSAILQCITGEDKDSVTRLIITASGGPFRTKTVDEIRTATVKDALNHPNWSMGNKITIDSATLMNKGLEVMEAKWLFDMDIENIDVVIHPQSIIHSMVEFADGSIKAQMGIPDMKIPIQYAITYPERIKSDFPRMDFKKYDTLTFEEPDLEKFECLKLAYDVLRDGGTYPVVLNAANEVAIGLFLEEKIGFMDIPAIIKKSLDKHQNITDFTLEDIIEADTVTREEIYNINSYK